MPIAYEIDEAGGLTIIRLSGDVAASEFQRYFSATRNDPKFSTQQDRLVIALGVTSFPSAAEVATLASEIRRRTTERSVRCAVVADTPLGLGMANMILAHAGMADRYATFANEAAAREWLGTEKGTAPR